jgi:hypothetical protein
VFKWLLCGVGWLLRTTVENYTKTGWANKTGFARYLGPERKSSLTLMSRFGTGRVTGSTSAKASQY